MIGQQQVQYYVLKFLKVQGKIKLDPGVYENLQKEKCKQMILFLQKPPLVMLNAQEVEIPKRQNSIQKQKNLPKFQKESTIKKIVQDIALHDLDVANSRPQGGYDFSSMMG